MISGVTPQSTTAGLAGAVPKESDKSLERTGSSDLPGSFPETPAAETSEFNAKPIPATFGTGNPVNLAPGEKVPDPSTLTSNTISSTVHDDPSLSKDLKDSEPTFGVAPIPATAGSGNPVDLKPGEKVPDPSSFTSNTIDSTVRLDKETYENGSAAPQLPNVVTPEKEREAKGFGMFGLPEGQKNLIPESSLPMGAAAFTEKDLDPHIQSAGPESSTAQLAGQVSLEPRGVPEMVQESRNEAGFAPEASANQEAVMEKSEVEQELESKVPEEPPTSESTAAASGGAERTGLTGGQTAGIAAGGAGALSAGAAALGLSSNDKSSEGTTSMPPRGIPQSVQESISQMNQSSGTAIAPAVPDVVQESITKAHVSPEAAAIKEMVKEKSAMENQLLNLVKSDESSGTPAPTDSATMSDSAPAPTSQTKAAEPGLAAAGMKSTATPLSQPAAPPATKSTETPLPEPSYTTTAAAPPATKSTEEPLSTSTSQRDGLAAPAATPATTQAAKPFVDSRDVSPMSKGPASSSTPAQPSVTTGVGSSTAPTTSPAATTSTPKKAAPASQASPMSAKTGESSASGEAKKNKRVSGFFGKLKSKFSDKDKK